MRISIHLAVLCCLEVFVQGVTKPPAVVQEPDYEVFYKAGEAVELPCYAEGWPRPEYMWIRNNLIFNTNGNDDRVVQMPDSGTIVITRPESRDEGIFQCRVTNMFGTSMSKRVNLREAKLQNFPVESTVTLNPQLGKPLTLNCVPPESIPPAQVFWVINRDFGGFDAIIFDARITMDHEDRLRITNVNMSDWVNGGSYACMAMNSMMRKSTQGRKFILDPRGTLEEPMPAKYMWASPDDSVGLYSSNFTLQCIFSGYPTPDVHWRRMSDQPLPDRARIQSFGQELMIENLQFEDAGTYECWATNVYSQTRVQRTMTVRVESRPFWLQEPENQERVAGGTATFNCLANGVPEPEYYWFVNGVPLASVLDPRIDSRFQRLRPDSIVFSNLTLDDSMVIQCNVTNRHGYIWGDVYLNVLPSRRWH